MVATINLKKLTSSFYIFQIMENAVCVWIAKPVRFMVAMVTLCFDVMFTTWKWSVMENWVLEWFSFIMDKYNMMTTYDEDDLYSGFNEFHPTLNTSSLIQDSLSRDVKNQQSMLQMQVFLLIRCV